MRADLFFNVIQLLVTLAGNKAIRNHDSVDLIKVGDHLPKGHAVLVVRALDDHTLYVSRQQTQLDDQGNLNQRRSIKVGAYLANDHSKLLELGAALQE